MRFVFLYISILLAIVFNTNLAAQQYTNVKQADSILLIESTNHVYKTPDKSIKIGQSIFNNQTLPNTTRCRALMLVALAYTSKRDYQNALEYVIKARDLAKDVEDIKLQVEILFRIGILYQQLKIYDKSIEYLEKTEQVALTHPTPNDVRKYVANSYIVKGFIYKDNLNCDIALEYFNRGIREYEKLTYDNHSANLSIVYYNQGNCYSQLSQYIKAKESFNTSINHAKQAKANSLISFAQKGLANVFLLEGKYNDAITLLQSALEQSKEVGDLVLNSGIYEGLFQNYLALNNWKNYQKYYNLYLATQLEIKASERSSINDSILEDSKKQKEKLTNIKQQFYKNVKQALIVIIIFISTIFFLNKKNKKTIKQLNSTVKSYQNTKIPAQEKIQQKKTS